MKVGRSEVRKYLDGFKAGARAGVGAGNWNTMGAGKGDGSR